MFFFLFFIRKLVEHFFTWLTLMPLDAGLIYKTHYYFNFLFHFCKQKSLLFYNVCRYDEKTLSFL